MERTWAVGNAFQPSEKDKEKILKLSKEFRYQTWAPESVIPVGDSYIFYNDMEDLKEMKWLYNHVKDVFHNKGYTSDNQFKHMNLIELNKKHDYFVEHGLTIKANEVFDYIKENYGSDFVDEE